MAEHGDEKNAYKILELYEKMNENKFIVGFTGHFSAGKSSMIYALLEKNILPKSPIPTSGNIVEITSGKGFARVFFNDDTSVLYEEPYDIELIKEFSKDNEMVKKVELNMSEQLLPEGCVIVDTPGIDAADDADRLMTESSLHLFDCLFYVMDYNHVQSEVNLYFLKQIQKRGIPFYVIINQIDKHNELELPFQTFIDSVKQTFNQWGVYPIELFYSSLLDETNRLNQFQKIKKQLYSLFSSNNEQIQTIEQAVKQIISDHKVYLEDIYEQKSMSFTDQDLLETDLSEKNDLENKLNELKQLPEKFKQDFQNDLGQTLKNAYLMPASLREDARLSLEAQQKGFKIGWIGSKKKTDEERIRRLNRFLQPLQKNIEATIQWNFRDKVIALLNQYQLSDPTLIQSTKQLAIEYTVDDLITLIKPGAQINGPYVLNYTNDVSADIKNKYKNQARKLAHYIQEEIKNQSKDIIIDYENQLTYVEKTIEKTQQLNDLQQNLAGKLNQINQQMATPHPKQTIKELMDQKLLEKTKVIKKADDTVLKKQDVSEEEISIIKEETPQHRLETITDITRSIDQAIATIQDLPGFHSLIEELTLKKNNLNNRSLTIALFGAFSAGKSSFSNALLGEALLPSSPNPTTAVISRISPVTEKYKHGTVAIQLKDEPSLIKDILDITEELTPPSTDLAGLINWMKEQKVFQNEQLNHVHRSYLHAIILGFQEIDNQLGQLITIEINEFENYVTDETKACFIEVVTLYYDCSLTRLGITLVDTPGADSVHARHTSVAFDYIKYADAILYVTYYNHALSRADKEFLMQLGRVKEAFELDKMFFVINAADLAENDAELTLVIDYVEDQLLQLGIRFPRIFPISSKESLENKVKHQQLNEQMRNFETNFYQFIQQDLVALSIQSAFWDIERAYQVLKNYMKTIHMDVKEKENFRVNLLETKGKLVQVIDQSKAEVYSERISQRIDRQLHYVKERLAIRFHDLFKDRFNPVTISNSGRKAHQQLANQLRILIDDIGYELLQELRAVSLRIESFLLKLTEEVYDDFQDRTKAIDNKFTLPTLETETLETPAYQQAFLKLDLKQFNKALNLFKGTKAFFVEGERDVMKEAIYDILVPYIQQYITDYQQIMNQSYLGQWEELFAVSKQQVEVNILQYVENNLEMLVDTVDINVLNEKQKILKSMIRK